MKLLIFSIVSMFFALSLTSASAQVEARNSGFLPRSITETKLLLDRAAVGITNFGTRLVVQDSASKVQAAMTPRPAAFTLLNSLDLGIRRIEVLTILPSGGPSLTSSYTSTNYASRIIVYDDGVLGVAPTNVFRSSTAIGGTVLLPLSLLQRRRIEVEQFTVIIPR